MDEQTIHFACPQCSATYELPASAVGQQGECAQCGFVFTIEESQTPAGEEQLPATPTNTVRLPKLSQEKQGMRPTLADDKFKIGVTTTQSGIQQKTGSGFRRCFSSGNPDGKPVVPAKPKKWWQFWK